MKINNAARSNAANILNSMFDLCLSENAADSFIIEVTREELQHITHCVGQLSYGIRMFNQLREALGFEAKQSS